MHNHQSLAAGSSINVEGHHVLRSLAQTDVELLEDDGHHVVWLLLVVRCSNLAVPEPRSEVRSRQSTRMQMWRHDEHT